MRTVRMSGSGPLALPFLPTSPHPEILAGRYRLEASLGEGGMSTIDRAVDLQCERVVAIKRLRPEYAREPEAIARLTREARILDRLLHTNCLRLLDCAEDVDGTPFLVLPLLVGRDLRSAHRGPLPLHQAIGLVLQLLDGLIHIHKRGFIHRDIKLENLFLTRSEDLADRLIIVDFGVAGLPKEAPFGDGLQTAVGTRLGTPGVMSPEQIVSGDVDHRSDLYAVGAVFYELLSGSPPFKAPSVLETMRLQVRTDPAPLSDVPEGIWGFVQSMMERSPQDRPASATEAREHLANIWTVLRRRRYPATTLDLLGPGHTTAKFETQLLRRWPQT